MFWQLASSDKVEVLKSRVNLFWSRIKRPLEEAVMSGELQATEADIRGLSQALYFFLAGATSSYESKLMNIKYFMREDVLAYRHISRIMNYYQWRKPITQEMMLSLTSKISAFLDRDTGQVSGCNACLTVGKKWDCDQ